MISGRCFKAAVSAEAGKLYETVLGRRFALVVRPGRSYQTGSKETKEVNGIQPAVIIRCGGEKSWAMFAVTHI